MNNPLMTEAELKQAIEAHAEDLLSWGEANDGSIDGDTIDSLLKLFTEQSRAYAETIVTTALKNLKSIEYPPSGKEYHFIDGSWSNS